MYFFEDHADSRIISSNISQIINRAAELCHEEVAHKTTKRRCIADL